MRKVITIIGSLALLVAAAPAFATGNINAVLGARPLKNEAYWGDLDRPAAIGVQADVSIGPVLPLFFNVGAMYIGDVVDEEQDPTYEASDIGELSLGLRVMPRRGLVRPYAGAGVQRDWISVESNAAGDDGDVANGWYAEGGALFQLGAHFNLGLNLRWVKVSDVKLYGNADGDLDSRGYSFVVGYSWGNPRASRHHSRRAE